MLGVPDPAALSPLLSDGVAEDALQEAHDCLQPLGGLGQLGLLFGGIIRPVLASSERPAKTGAEVRT
jgi:hypothetical protein